MAARKGNALVEAVERGVDVCSEIARLRFRLHALEKRVKAAQADDEHLGDLRAAIAACEEIARLRVDLVSLGRQLKEHDEDLTPVRPPSRADIEAAFTNSVEFAQGAKKPSKGS